MLFILKSILASGGPRVDVTVTSNGTVLTDRILDFLLEHQVYVQFSLDGGKSEHNLHRKFKHSSKGSYDTILKNLEKIHARDPEYFRTHLRLKGVITPETIDVEDSEFNAHPLIRDLVGDCRLTMLQKEPNYDLAKDHEYFEMLDPCSGKTLLRRDCANESELLQGLNERQRLFYIFTFGRFFESQMVKAKYFGESDSTPFTKGCLTGYQEGAVGTNGDISICLKSAKGDHFVIGNVMEGQWYFDKIRALNTTFHDDWEGCRSCFLQKVCDVCYEKLNGEDGQWVAGRAKFCEFNRERHRVIFRYMLNVMTNNPRMWEWFEDSLAASAAPADRESQPLGSSSLFEDYDGNSL